MYSLIVNGLSGRGGEIDPISLIVNPTNSLACCKSMDREIGKSVKEYKKMTKKNGRFFQSPFHIAKVTPFFLRASLFLEFFL